MQKILVVGGAGYIGSHTVRQLIKSGYNVSVLDNLSTGFKAALPQGVELFNCDILNLGQIESVFSQNKFDAIFHFAARLSVPESFLIPADYYLTNVSGTINLLAMCSKYKINKFVFSSTAAVYGEVLSKKVSEEDICRPQNPYGKSKLIAEDIIRQYAEVQKDFHYKILRYFNVAGAELDGTAGPRNINSGQLILNLCKSALAQTSVDVYGTDFPTADGSAIRDYIHVVDLARAHVAAFDQLAQKNINSILNCGYGAGFSVLHVIRAFEKANQVKFSINYKQRRVGDPSEVVADNTKLTTQTSWKPLHDDLELICKTSYQWIKNGI